MIGVVDYGLGNVQAFINIYRRFGIEAAPVKTATELEAATRLVLPGVGAFDWAMERLEASGMLNSLNSRVLGDGVPVLGVCVGMQIMARQSDEGSRAGLGWLDADVRLLDTKALKHSTHLPHMGWNDVVPSRACSLFSNIENAQFYFLHSYYFSPNSEEIVLAHTTYGVPFASAANKGNIFATQFHPEKSHRSGMQLLKNFAEI